MRRTIRLVTASVLLPLALFGCRGGSDDTGSSDWVTDGDAGVGQGGAQDFGAFRAILEAGGIPGPDTIDDVGFFHEHKIALPPATCGESVCLHARLGMMGNMIDGSDCTVIVLGMNTPIDPSTLERPPLNLALAIDTSGSMTGDAIAYVRTGLIQMLPSLEAGDRIHLVTFSTVGTTEIEDAAGDDPALATAFGALEANGGTNLFDGLRLAYEAVDRHASDDTQNRVILLSDGVPTQGTTDSGSIVALASQYASLGYPLTTIGMGDDFDSSLLRTLSEVGAGAFYFVEDPSSVSEVFTEEVEFFLVPLAEDAEIDVRIDGGYDLRAGYGSPLLNVGTNVAKVHMPTLQIAHRTSVDEPDGQGRRGGGGAIVLEMIPVGSSSTVGEVEFTYTDPATDEEIAQASTVLAPQGASSTWFADDPTEKAFVMLNLYVGFEIAATRAAANDDDAALAVLTSLEANVSDWLGDHPDSDIEDDLRYVRMFIDNLEARGAAADEEAEDPWPAD